ncbi:tRNA(His) guanylyltransferase Thg1 family protein [Methanobacterium aggregans]|uniref:tRNA(His) guanylyltransferase Thg1 family protein n=1 Tax=Methanobacterium aggregans TaxID=1615586 RepID=UPI001AE48365|nr:tRNA(His) guanylyltransferase Thg1 family protein [Methanobacterium aggregans]MBP2046183.1 tRNA(His) 5'-end guanylyltransferase [Methanobacterium aggregans]
MKECEIFSNLKIPCGSKILLRMDGRGFSKLSRRIGFKKPYDIDFARAMVESCRMFSEEFAPSLVYTFSDEINVLLSDVPFGGRVEKLDSVFSGFISSAFTVSLMKVPTFRKYMDGSKPISFDCRIIPVSRDMVVDYFKNRQDEAWRNCINGYAYWMLREDHSKEEAVELLQMKKSRDLHELIFERGINIVEVPAWQRRGIGMYKKRVQVEGYNPISRKNVVSERLKLLEDWNLPLFDETFLKNTEIL